MRCYFWLRWLLHEAIKIIMNHLETEVSVAYDAAGKPAKNHTKASC